MSSNLKGPRPDVLDHALTRFVLYTQILGAMHLSFVVPDYA